MCVIISVSSVGASLFDDDSLTIEGVSFDTPSGSKNVHSLDPGTGSFVLNKYTCMVSSMSEDEYQSILDEGNEVYDTFGFSKIYKSNSYDNPQLFMMFKEEGKLFKATVLPNEGANDLDDMKRVLTRFCSVNPTRSI